MQYMLLFPYPANVNSQSTQVSPLHLNLKVLRKHFHSKKHAPLIIEQHLACYYD